MWNGFIGKQINRTNRNILITNLGILSIPLAIGIIGGQYWQNFFAGPASISGVDLVAIKDIESMKRDYVSIKGDQTIDTGVEEITTTKRRGVTTGSRVSANIVALKLNDRILIVKAKPENVKDSSFTGQLKPLPVDLEGRVVTPVVQKNPGLKTMFLPYMLDQQADYQFGGYFGLFIGIPCAAFALWNLQKVGRRWGKPENHPIAKQISVAGEAETVAAQVEAELSAPTAHTVGKTTITPSWLFQPTTYGMNALRLEDLVWFYHKVTTHRTNGIPTGKTYSTVLYDRSGRTFEMNSSEQQVQEILTILYDKAPWAISGYSDDLQKMWKKERSSLISAVDDRRQAA
jgi:hypothetical protein